MWDSVKLIALALIAFFAALAADWGHDLAYRVHALIILITAFGLFVWTLRQVGEDKLIVQPMRYRDDVIRAGVIATAFWASSAFWRAFSLPSSWLSRCSTLTGVSRLQISVVCARFTPAP